MAISVRDTPNTAKSIELKNVIAIDKFIRCDDSLKKIINWVRAEQTASPPPAIPHGRS